MTTLEVHVQIDGRTVVAGTAWFHRRRTLSTTFEYARSYLADPAAYPIDPGLPLFGGPHTSDGLPGAFGDCAPDRWGRNLIRKRVRAEALEVGRTPPSVGEVDCLLGVSDLTRQGALRFREPPSADFLATDAAVPTLIELPTLLRAADAVEAGDDDFAAIKALTAAGTGTLGGARPKVSIRDGDRLFVAKFPKPNDQWDVIAWEMTALDLAERASLPVPSHRLLPVGRRSVLLLDRFDRRADRRIGYLSVMTMLGSRDGEAADYVEIAETLPEFAERSRAALQDLWRRVAFSIATHNTDDHLRNHGLLRSGRGWVLSPVFDVNPNPDAGESRATTIGHAAGPAEELEALMAYAPTFRLTRDDAAAMLREIADATAQWRQVAVHNGIAEREISRFRDTLDLFPRLASSI